MGPASCLLAKKGYDRDNFLNLRPWVEHNVSLPRHLCLKSTMEWLFSVSGNAGSVQTNLIHYLTRERRPLLIGKGQPTSCVITEVVDHQQSRVMGSEGPSRGELISSPVTSVKRGRGWPRKILVSASPSTFSFGLVTPPSRVPPFLCFPSNSHLACFDLV